MKSCTLATWHQRLGHLHYDMIQKMAQSGSVLDLNITPGSDSTHFCSGCIQGKNSCIPFPVNITRHREDTSGVMFHSDICGPMGEISYGGALYYILFKDDHSSYRFAFCIKQKSEALNCFKMVFQEVLRITHHRIQILRTDNGGEYFSKTFQAYLLSENIRHELTVPYTPQ